MYILNKIYLKALSLGRDLISIQQTLAVTLTLKVGQACLLQSSRSQCGCDESFLDCQFCSFLSNLNHSFFFPHDNCHRVRILDTTRPLKMVKMVNFTSRVFYHNKKIGEKREIEIPLFWSQILSMLKNY